jgi:hypothetical protein
MAAAKTGELPPLDRSLKDADVNRLNTAVVSTELRHRKVPILRVAKRNRHFPVVSQLFYSILSTINWSLIVFYMTEVCALDKDRGSCRNFTVKWFFDMEYGGCSRFWWGGCDGNDNRFASQDDCKAHCVEPEGIRMFTL